jgi:transcriptional regulator with XRE-family HTH domain
MDDVLTPRLIFGRRVREERARLGLSQQALVDRLAEYGLSMDRSTLVKLEKGDDKEIASPPLDRVLAFAASLRVPPLALLMPAASEEPFQVTPNTIVPAWYARASMHDPRYPLPEAGVNWFKMNESTLRRLIYDGLTRGMTPITRALVEDKLDEEVGRLVDKIRNPLKREENDG